MKVCCGNCAEVIDGRTQACPHCGYRKGSNKAGPLPGRAGIRLAKRRSRGAKYAAVFGASALHVTGTMKGSKTSGGLPSLGKRR